MKKIVIALICIVAIACMVSAVAAYDSSTVSTQKSSSIVHQHDPIEGMFILDYLPHTGSLIFYKDGTGRYEWDNTIENLKWRNTGNDTYYVYHNKCKETYKLTSNGLLGAGGKIKYNRA